MTNQLASLHPDDLLFFQEVSTAMRRVAKRYELPLRSIEPATMPESGMIDYLGKCYSTGDIELVMRATVDGQFCDSPRTPSKVWETAAHELAHLKYMNHGPQFHEFFAELMVAMDNQQEDHRAKVIDKLVKMQRQRDGEAKLGNAAAAEAFAAAINRMLIDNELNASDIDYARANDNDPIIELRLDLSKYKIDPKSHRIAWQERLARVVAKAHLCTFLIRGGSNVIWFVGTKSHATVAEYVYGTLVPNVEHMAKMEYRQFRGSRRGDPATHGFKEAWKDAFIQRIAERFDEARQAAVAEVPVDVPGSHSTALIRLNGAMVKVQRYIDDKFKAKRSSLSALAHGRSTNQDGRIRGRAAADKMPIGRRGIGGGGTRGLLK